MVRDEERKIIEQEIDRLEMGWRNAQERYGITGSRSTDRTMYKYDVIKNALENYLNNNADSSKERMIQNQQDQLYKIKEAIGKGYREGLLHSSIYVQIMDILRG